MSYLRVIALTAAAAFAAIAIYISTVEQPARLLLDARPALMQWSAGFPTALKIQGGMAMLCGVLGGFLWWRTRNWLWLVGAVVILANWPFTLLWLAPINSVLISTPADQAGAATQSLIARWGDLHMVRSGLGLLAMALFAAATLRELPRSAAQPK